MAKIFAYTKEAKISATALKKLEAAGIIPIQVASLADIRFIEPAPDGEGSAVMRAALRAIQDDFNASSSKLFGDYVAEEMLRSKEPAP